MLNGIQPILIIQLSALAGNLEKTAAKIPILSKVPSLIAQPPIPIYLADDITGMFILQEDKNVDISTDVQTHTDGTDPTVDQKGIGSSVTITIKGKKDSLPIILISAMMDVIFDKVTSKEYSISYLHGATTIFGGLLSNFSVSQDSNTDVVDMKMEFTKGKKSPTEKPAVPVVPKTTGVLPL